MKIVRKHNVNKGNSKQVYHSSGMSKYVFPYETSIRAGKYISIVEDAKETTTSRGKDGIIVYYKIRDAIDLYNRINEKVPEGTPIKTYYIKQIYPEGTGFYDAFLDSMAEALDTESVNLNDVVGVIEYVTLSYKSKDSMGGYSKRQWTTLENFVNFCIDLEQQNNGANNIYDDNCDESCESVEEDNENLPARQISDGDNPEDYDEEYDDFFPDDEEDW